MAGTHFLCVFGAEVAHAPEGILRSPSAQPPRYPKAEEVLDHEATCERLVKSSFDVCKAKPNAKASVKFPGKGCGLMYEHSPFCSYATREGIHVVISGEVSEWPGVNAVAASHNAYVRNEAPPEENDAHWLLDFYRTFTDPDLDDEEVKSDAVMDRALECLAEVQGSFAFVIFDSIRHRVLAARDREGACPLYWGTTEDGGQLLIGTQLDDLVETNPSATGFPAGCLFASEHHMLAYQPGEQGWLIAGDNVPGELLSFVAAEDAAHFRGVRAIPRITSKGTVCGAVYKVASSADMSKPVPQH